MERKENKLQFKSGLFPQLSCPTCQVYFTPPIYQCTNGHSLCSHCSEIRNICPDCNTSLAQVVRNITLERMLNSIEIQCKYQGCGQLINLVDRESHEANCGFNPDVNCVFRDCGWVGPDIFQHLKTCHDVKEFQMDAKGGIRGWNSKTWKNADWGYSIWRFEDECILNRSNSTGEIFYLYMYDVSPTRKLLSLQIQNQHSYVEFTVRTISAKHPEDEQNALPFHLSIKEAEKHFLEPAEGLDDGYKRLSIIVKLLEQLLDIKMVIPSQIATVDTQSQAPIQDAQLNYFGNKLAVGNQLGQVKVFSVNESNTLLSDFPAHESSVLRLSWSHPKFGNLLATGGSEGVVKIWKEDSRHNWSPVYQQDTFNAPVTALSWSPQQIGFNLLSASADGCVSILTFFGGSSWENAKFFAHEGGVLSAVWSPEIYSTLLANDNDQFTKCFVSGGVDGTIKLWRSEEGQYASSTIGQTGSWVRCLTWGYNFQQERHMIAYGQDSGRVAILVYKGNNWQENVFINNGPGVTTINWANNSHQLQISLSDGAHKLFQINADGSWEDISPVLKAEGEDN